jgi:hypothetical protein
MEDSRDMGMSQLRGGTRFAAESFASLGIVAETTVNDLERNSRTKVGISRAISDSHRSASQFIESNSVLSGADLVVLEMPEFGAGFVRAAEQQAVETTEEIGSTWQRRAALFATHDVIVANRHGLR